jgi:hypothetical protein
MLSPQEIVNKCVYEQSVIILESVFENDDDKLLDLCTLKKEFKNIWMSSCVEGSSISTTTKKPEKKKRIVKIIPDEDRCNAKKKDGGRCAAKKNTTGVNPLVCSLHNSKGVNFGIFGDDVIVAEETKEILKDSRMNKLKSSEKKRIEKIKELYSSDSEIDMSGNKSYLFHEKPDEPFIKGSDTDNEFISEIEEF